MFEQLRTNIFTKLGEILPDSAPLAFAIELDRNKNGKSTGYAVTIESSSATGDLVGRTTLNANISVKVMKSYQPDKNGDSAQLTASLQVADLLLAAFEGLSAAKLATPGVRLVTLDSISEPSYQTDEKTVSRTLTIVANIKV